MSICIVYYCPGAAGNHLKNIINLDPNMRGHADLDMNIYGIEKMNQGTAHARAGRNVIREELEHIARNPEERWCICAHFGELAPKRDLLMQIPDRKIVIISIESPADRWLLETRQKKLGQNCHPYWLHEEQPYLYDRAICKEYWRTPDTIKISLEHFWHPDLQHHTIVPELNRFLGTNINEETARDLHRAWWTANFDREDLRDFYLKKSNPEIVA